MEQRSASTANIHAAASAAAVVKKGKIEMNKAKVMKVFGVASIVLGAVLMVVCWQFLFSAIGSFGIAILFRSIGHIFAGIGGVFIYFFATTGFVISGIKMLRQKKWAAFFSIGIVLWSTFLFFYFMDMISSERIWKERQKQADEGSKRLGEELKKEREYWQEKWRERQGLEEKGN